MQPLNPWLYRRLEAVWGQVRITNEGEAMRAAYRWDPLKGKVRLIVDHPGEYYQICCPRCGDTRFRLWINHAWGRPDDQGRRNLWLMVCYNEDCFADADNRQEFFRKVVGNPAVYDREPLNAGRHVSEEELSQREIMPPGPMTPLQDLPDTHPANRYLLSRGFEPRRLGSFYGVSYCPESHYTFAANRIIIPVRRDGLLVGWQARHVGDADWKETGIPKYFIPPGMKKSRLLYNIDAARQYDCRVVVEGCSDVWAVGPMGVGIFGSIPSQKQAELLIATSRYEPVAIVVDPDVRAKEPKKYQKLQTVIARLRQSIGAVAEIQLPEGTDPGSLERGFLRRFIAEQAAAQGVDIRFTRKERTEHGATDPAGSGPTQ